MATITKLVSFPALNTGFSIMDLLGVDAPRDPDVSYLLITVSGGNQVFFVHKSGSVSLPADKVGFPLEIGGSVPVPPFSGGPKVIDLSKVILATATAGMTAFILAFS